MFVILCSVLTRLWLCSEDRYHLSLPMPKHVCSFRSQDINRRVGWGIVVLKLIRNTKHKCKCITTMATLTASGSGLFHSLHPLHVLIYLDHFTAPTVSQPQQRYSCLVLYTKVSSKPLLYSTSIKIHGFMCVIRLFNKKKTRLCDWHQWPPILQISEWLLKQGILKMSIPSILMDHRMRT